MNSILSAIVLITGITASIPSAQACSGPNCAIAVQANGIIEMGRKTHCIKARKTEMACIYEYGATFQVLRTSQIDHNQWGGLITSGGNDEISIDTRTGWSRVYLANGDYTFGSSEKNSSMISVRGEVPKSSTASRSELSTFDEISGAKALIEAREECDKLLKDL